MGSACSGSVGWGKVNEKVGTRRRFRSQGRKTVEMEAKVKGIRVAKWRQKSRKKRLAGGKSQRGKKLLYGCKSQGKRWLNGGKIQEKRWLSGVKSRGERWYSMDGAGSPASSIG